MKKWFLTLPLLCALLVTCPDNSVEAAARAGAKSNTIVKENVLPTVKMTGPKLDVEYGQGVEGAFVGIINNQLIMAGGSTASAGSFSYDNSKKYFKDIYGAVVNNKSKKLTWKKIGTLPEALANGATAVDGNNLYLVGGENQSGVKSWIQKLHFEGTELKVETVKYMPVLIKECGAAVIDDTLYIVGGVQNGKASSKMYGMSLQDTKLPWKFLAACPDYPRQQPVVTAQKDNFGKSQLYIWGGYVAKSAEQNAQISCGGYSYDPDRAKWKILPAPLDSQQARIYLGGGNLAAGTEHKIFAFGGYDYSALKQILTHSASKTGVDAAQANGFNQHVYCYDLSTNKWQNLGIAADTARVAAGVAVLDNTVYLVEGETKPGICTPLITRISL